MSSISSTPRGETIEAVFAALDDAGLPYCVTHGYETLPCFAGSDIDIAVPAAVTAEDLRLLLSRNRARLRARIVRQYGLYFVLLCEREPFSPDFVILDFCHGCDIGGARLMSADEIVSRRRRWNGFCIPSPEIEFSCLVARGLASRGLAAGRGAHLAELYRGHATSIRHELARTWSEAAVEAICAAAVTRDWEAANMAGPRRELHAHLARATPFFRLRRCAKAAAARIRRLADPPGFHLVMLGPDGAGKSTVVEALERSMSGPFSKVVSPGFAPPLYKLWRKGPVKTDKPHELKARSYSVSVLRGLFWLVYNLSGYVTLRWAKARSVLVVNDRHFIDILVDPIRYRYGGPRWLLAFIAKVIPKPDAIILLNGSAAVLNARKREVSIGETERQCRDYLALVSKQKRSHAVDAEQPLDGVMRDVCAIIFPERPPGSS